MLPVWWTWRREAVPDKLCNLFVIVQGHTLALGTKFTSIQSLINKIGYSSCLKIENFCYFWGGGGLRLTNIYTAIILLNVEVERNVKWRTHFEILILNVIWKDHTQCQEKTICCKCWINWILCSFPSVIVDHKMCLFKSKLTLLFSHEEFFMKIYLI